MATLQFAPSPFLEGVAWALHEKLPEASPQALAFWRPESGHLSMFPASLTAVLLLFGPCCAEFLRVFRGTLRSATDSHDQLRLVHEKGLARQRFLERLPAV